MTTESYIQSSLREEDESFEVPLRPQTLLDFSGQENIRERLQVVIGAAMKREDALGHCLLCGPPGLGKTTLANIIAKAMGTNLVVTSGPVIEKAGDLAGMLTGLKKGDVLFIDEIHRLNRVVEEYLYPAMENFTLDLIIDSGPAARSVQLKLEEFTLIGATTRAGLITGPLRSRFQQVCRLEHYEPEVLQKIVLRSSKILGIELEEEGAMEIAKRARGTPRIANNLLRWVRDYAQMRTKENKVSRESVDKALCMLAIDEKGLDEMDKKIMEVIIDHHDGGPVGLNTMAAAIGEDASTIEEMYEPYLIMHGFLRRTPRGREATFHAYKHFNKRKDGFLI